MVEYKSDKFGYTLERFSVREGEGEVWMVEVMLLDEEENSVRVEMSLRHAMRFGRDIVQETERAQEEMYDEGLDRVLDRAIEKVAREADRVKGPERRRLVPMDAQSWAMKGVYDRLAESKRGNVADNSPVDPRLEQRCNHMLSPVLPGVGCAECAAEWARDQQSVGNDDLGTQIRQLRQSIVHSNQRIFRLEDRLHDRVDVLMREVVGAKKRVEQLESKSSESGTITSAIQQRITEIPTETFDRIKRIEEGLSAIHRWIKRHDQGLNTPSEPTIVPSSQV